MGKYSALLVGTAALLLSPAAFAQLGNGTNPECLTNSCGRPQEEGGGCGCGCGCSVWVAYTDDGTTLSYTDDADGDGKADDRDNCPFASNRDQIDGDGDLVGNSCDNCPMASNFSQLDADGDGLGNACDLDIDGDLLENQLDNCPVIPNKLQADLDRDAMGDPCDADDDNDGTPDGLDNCPRVPNPGNAQVAPELLPQCNVDFDRDNVGDGWDNCPEVANPNQADVDGDKLGDVCDADIDDDGILNPADNCAGVPNRFQLDDDGDLVGDACDPFYCVVIDPNNKDDCLNPNGPFKVHAGGTLMVKHGDKVRLPLFANRNGAAIEYTFTVTQRPKGSTAAIDNPKGAVSLSRHWEYAYVDGSVPTFTPDVPGEYVVQLKGVLAFPDRAYPEATESVSELRITVEPKAQGCTNAVAPLHGPAAALLLAALGVLRRRRP